jgi:outer membrane protein assembly factor BamE (lipoprotein component of BamABCDE complex)
MNNKIPYVLLCLFIGLSACMSASQHKADVQDNSTDRVTVGTVQKEIKVGLSAAEVAAALGSPNIVSTDEERREVWIYDKIASDRVVSQDEGFGSLLILGSSGTRGASTSSQRTLTIIIKFNKDNKVRDFSYHTSRF